MNFFRTMFRCCSGFRPYREVRDLPVRSSLLYLVQLVALLGLVLAARFVPWGWQFATLAADWTRDHVPPFRIQQGKVLSDTPQPYRTGDENFLFLLDTTGKTTAADPQAMHGILVTSDALTFWLKADTEPASPVFAQRHSLSGFPDSEVNAAYVRNLLLGAVAMSVPMLLGGAFCVALAQVLLFSFAAALLERGMASGLRWSQLFNIALHAVTPAAIIFTTYAAMRLKGLDLQLIYIIAYGIFLLGATSACRETLADETTSDRE